jgi:hypothetical protein
MATKSPGVVMNLAKHLTLLQFTQSCFDDYESAIAC